VINMPLQMPMSASGRFIVDARGRRVRLAGVNWYGFHEDDGIAPGLDRADRRALAWQIALLGFNSVRLPFSLWMTEQATPIPGRYLTANPDLSGATPMQVYDACVEALTDAGLIVIPNCHTLDPGWPLPTSTQILTRSGWKYHYEVEEGDETLGYEVGELRWTPILATRLIPDQPVVRFGQKNGWSTVTTENHRWLTQSRTRTGAWRPEIRAMSAKQAWSGNNRLVLTAPAEGGKSECTPDEARILAWILSDGNIGIYAGELQAWIFQSDAKYGTEVRELILREGAGTGTGYATNSQYGKCKRYRVRTSYIRRLLLKTDINLLDPIPFILGLSRKARAAWLETWVKAEGDPRGRICQNCGPLLDAICLAVYLEGRRPRISNNGRTGNKKVTSRPPTVTGFAAVRHYETLPKPVNVWCPTTGNGSWTARDAEDNVFLTGNCCSEDDAQGLWFNDRWPPGKFLAAWRDMAARYASNPLVAGMDIMNEPRRSRVGGRVLTPAWGTGSVTDIAAVYTAAGNLIHKVSPEVLIICEGVGFAADLTGVARHPVRLEHPGKVVYSLHDYSWYHPTGQPRTTYFDQMHRAGGYILTEDIAPLWIGEFGNDTRSLDNFGRAASPAAGWWNNVEAWLTEHDVDWCWWPLNPNQPRGTVPVTGQHRSRWGDPEPWGLLAPDWRGVANPPVLDVLRALIPARTGPGVVP
jgi:aryl-phospho-beta-D-glucosidase BglC (GH1 family)